MDYNDKLIVVTAPSGAGKTSLIRRLLEEDRDLTFSISHTTRAPRGSEKDGREYHFISPEVFQERIDKDYFIEWAEVHENFYGTSFEELDRQIALGKRVILDIDVQGCLQLMEKVKALYIFISVDSIDILRKRLKGRGTDSNEVIEKRLKNAAREMEYSKKWKHVIINADFERALEQLRDIIYAK